MSTKIYNGYKFKNTPKNLMETRDVILRIKTKIMDYYRKKYYRLLAEEAVVLFDDSLFFHKIPYILPNGDGKAIPLKECNLDSSMHTITYDAVNRKSDIYKKQTYRDGVFSECDFECSVVILPSNDNVFLMLFAEDRKIKNILLETGEIEEYPFWDNTDQPDEMSIDEWTKRGYEWDAALPYGIPSVDGFTMIISDGMLSVKMFFKEFPTKLEGIIENMPSLDARAERLTVAAMRPEWEETDEKELNQLVIERKYNEIEKSGKTFKQFLLRNMERFEKTKSNVKNIIKPEITIQDLQMTVGDFLNKYNIR